MNREAEDVKLRGAGHTAIKEFQKCGIGITEGMTMISLNDFG